MAPQTGTALLILGLFVLPGFVTLLLRERTYAIRGEDTAFERLLNALYYSALVYGIAVSLGWAAGLDKQDLVMFYRGQKSLGEDLVAGLVLALILPGLLSETGRLWRGSERVRPTLLKLLKISSAHSTYSAWDDVFGRKGGAMVRATLRDERVVGGLYSTTSFAGYSAHTQDLFIEERWELDNDGWFTAPAPGSLGVWVPRESIVSLDLYELPTGDADQATAPLVRVNVQS